VADGGRPSPGQRLLTAVAGRLAHLVLLAVGFTCRLRVVAGAEHLDAARAEGRPVVFAFWHDRLLFACYYIARHFVARGYPVAVLISPSRDGDLGTRVARHLGAESVRGSASRGGSGGVRGLLKAAARGRGLVMVPDGPRGPAHQAKPGTLVVAQLSGAPVLPLTWSADRVWRIKSWDRLEIPRPFTRVRLAAGEPILVPRRLADDDLDRHVAALETTLEDLGDLARRSLDAG
jgi:lysophospholipid acyltransferase (LPLAT)-like uncharacterized protein